MYLRVFTCITRMYRNTYKSIANTTQIRSIPCIPHVWRRLDDDGLEELETQTVGAHGDYSVAYNNVSDAFPIAIILGGAEIEDLSVDDIFNLVPNDTTPIDFARACLLMGAEARAVLAAALA